MVSSSQQAFEVASFSATFLNAIVFGIVLVFTVVVMPGIANLPSDVEMLQAFQVMDAVIQNNQPIFVLCWVGSVLTLVLMTGLGMATDVLGGNKLDRALLVIACSCMIAGQIATFFGNIPLNNHLQTLDFDYLQGEPDVAKAERERFEGPWNRYNVIRTVLFGITSLILLYLQRYSDRMGNGANPASLGILAGSVANGSIASYQKAEIVV